MSISLLLPTLEAAAQRAYSACAEYLTAAGDYAPAAEALRAHYDAVASARCAYDAGRPPGKLAPEHPWHKGLGELNGALRINEGLVAAVAARAAALRDGKLTEYDAAHEARTEAETRRFARAAAEIERREARTGRPLDETTRSVIVRAYTR